MGETQREAERERQTDRQRDRQSNRYTETDIILSDDILINVFFYYWV